VRNIEDAWEKETEHHRDEVHRDKAAMVIEFDIAAPRPMVRKYFTLPGRDGMAERRRGARDASKRPA
jgi:hypothetical protein